MKLVVLSLMVFLIVRIDALWSHGGGFAGHHASSSMASSSASNFGNWYVMRRSAPGVIYNIENGNDKCVCVVDEPVPQTKDAECILDQEFVEEARSGEIISGEDRRKF